MVIKRVTPWLESVIRRMEAVIGGSRCLTITLVRFSVSFRPPIRSVHVLFLVMLLLPRRHDDMRELSVSGDAASLARLLCWLGLISRRERSET